LQDWQHEVSIYQGKGTTAAGLTAAVMHDPESGAMTLEAEHWSCPIKELHAIDEFDKMDPDDRTAIHESHGAAYQSV